MTDLERQLIRARRRLNATLFLRVLSTSLVAGLLIGCLALTVGKIWPLPESWSGIESSVWATGVAITVIGLGTLVAIMITWARRITLERTAFEVDQRFGLRDRVRSAWGLRQMDADSAAGRLLRHDAEVCVQRIDIRDQFPIESGAYLWLPMIPALMLLGVALLPNAKRPQEATVTQAAASSEDVIAAIEQAKQKILEKAEMLSEKGLTEVADEFEAFKGELDRLEAGQGELKKEALVKLSDLRKQLEEEKSRLGDLNSIKSELGRLKDVAAGPAKQIEKALKEGDLQQAVETLKELSQKWKDGQLTESERKELGKDLTEMAKSVEEMVQRHEEAKQELEQQIQRAMQEGDPDKAAELQERLDSLKQQDRQMEKMQQLARKLEEAGQAMEPKSNESKNAEPKDGDQPKPGGGDQQASTESSGKKNESSNRSGQSAASEAQQRQAQKALDDLIEQMEEMKVDQETLETLQDLEDDLQECKDGMNQVDGEGMKRKPGFNDFAKGQGRGQGKREIEKDDTGAYKSRVTGKLQRGQTVVTGDADGENAKGVSLAEARQAMEAQIKQESDPIEDQQLPKAQRQQAREYFEQLRKGG